MVPSLIHLLVAATLAVLTLVAVRIWSRDRRSYTLIVILVGFGLTYDNAVLGVGRWLDHGAALEVLSWPRFVLHALSTPLLIIVGFGAARAFRVEWTRPARVHVGFCLLATFLVIWGIVTDVARLQLEAQSEDGIVSYGNASAAVPVPAIVTILVLIALGVVLWRHGWAWLAVGSTVMLVASGLGAVSGLLTNIGELSLIGALIATEREAGRRCRELEGRTTVSSGGPGRARS